MTGRFTVGDLKRVCPGVSYPTLQRALADLKVEREIQADFLRHSADFTHLSLLISRY